MIYGEIFRELNRAKVQYMVVGGVAVVLHGFVRLTADLDLVVLISSQNVRKFFSCMNKIGFRPRLPITVEQFEDKKLREDWKRGKNMKAFSFFRGKDPLQMVDILIQEEGLYQKLHKKNFEIRGVKIPVVSLPDLIRLKKKAARPKDLLDIEALEKSVRISKRKKKL